MWFYGRVVNSTYRKYRWYQYFPKLSPLPILMLFVLLQSLGSAFCVVLRCMCACIHASMRACIRPSMILFPQYLWYILRIFTNFTFVLALLWTKMNWLGFSLGQKSRSQHDQVWVCLCDVSSMHEFSPNFCRWCILEQRLADWVLGSEGKSSMSCVCQKMKLFCHCSQLTTGSCGQRQHRALIV